MNLLGYLRDHESKKKPRHTATRPTWTMRVRLPMMLFQKLAKGTEAPNVGVQAKIEDRVVSGQWSVASEEQASLLATGH
jgi:hypothetical protein